MNSDTIALLKECDAGCKMAADSLLQVRSYAEDGRLIAIIDKYLKRHRDFGNKCHRMLSQERETTQDPPKMASAFARISTDMKLMMEKDSHKIAEILIDGCNMGVKSVTENINKYNKADGESVSLARELVEVEQKLSQDLLQFL